MTFAEIVKRLRARGVNQARWAYARDVNGFPVYPKNRDKHRLAVDPSRITEACAVGAILYACTAGWITDDQARRLYERLTDAAVRHGYQDVTAANDAGVSFETFAEWEASA